MEITLETADFAQTEPTGKVHAIGLAWNVVGSPLPGHAVVIIFSVGWNETNIQHTFKLELLDADGQPVGQDGEPFVFVEGQFEQGRPPGLVHGSQMSQTVAINLPPGMPLEPGARYEYRVVAGAFTASKTFSVVVQ